MYTNTHIHTRENVLGTLNFFCNWGFRKAACRWDGGPLPTLPDSVSGDFLPRPFTFVYNQTLSDQRLGLSLHCPEVLALRSSTGRLAGRKHRVCPSQELERLRASALGHARPGHYRLGLTSPSPGLGSTDSRNWVLVMPLEGPVTIFMSL